MKTLLSRLALQRAGVGLAALLLAITALPTRAQTPNRSFIKDGEGGGVQVRRRGFRLFSNADLAGSGLHMTGQHGWGVTNIGPCADGFQVFQCGDIFVDGAFQFNWFELNYVAAVGPSDYNKVLAVHPGVSGMRAPVGYSTEFTGLLVGGPQDWGPADGSIGRFFSGVTSTNDGSCRDNTGALNGYMSTGVPLLAGSTCPETWANNLFDGPRFISDSAYIRLREQDPAGFSFDYWKVPAEERGKLLGNFATYGETSDYFAEVLQSYGSVTPLGGTAAPTIQGFPLGLDIRFEVFQFAFPALANAVFYNMTVVNNSEKVYGTGVDYDSLYMGLMPGWGSGQQNAVYYIPEQNAVKVNESRTNPACNGAISPPGVVACGSTVPGFTTGAKGIVMLKSPIGDMRNRLLSRATSPFYTPGSPFADDTITVNHGHMCSFGGACYNSVYLANDRRAFGMVSGTEANVLDGRDPASLTAATAWTTFRNRNFAGAANATVTRFNKYVPGGWDYNEDGVPDTLTFDTCAENGCVDAWADTMPGKHVNARANVGSNFNAGPFRLAAGDTTAFTFALVGSPDSASFEQLVRDVVTAYVTFYIIPEPPPVPTIVATEIASAEVRNETGNEPVVTLFFTDEPERTPDPFLLGFAAQLRAEADPTFRALNRLNPDLADEIEARAEQNFAALHIYKSCDDGRTFTSDEDCDGDPAVGVGGELLGVGWQPYEIIVADPVTGSIPNFFTDNDVFGGRTYLYSLVTASIGFSAPVVDVDPTDDSPACQADPTACRTIRRTLEVSPPALSPLNRSGPTVAKVYVPVSLPAGATAARFVATTTAGTATIPVNVRLSERAVAGDFRLVFGNRFIVRIETNLTTELVTSTVLVQDIVDSAIVGGVNQSNVMLRQDSLSGPGRLEFSGATFAPTITTSGDTRVEIDTIAGLGFVLARGTAPFFLSTNLTPEGATPSQFVNRPDFPGFLISLNQSAANALSLERIVPPSGDTIAVAIMNSNAVQFQEGMSTLRNNASGTYEFRFDDESFGPGAPFTLTTPEALQAAVTASLTSRQVAATGVTGEAFDSIVVNAIPAFATRPLLAAKFPFTVVSSSGGQIFLAMPRRTSNTILLGNGADTARVTVPADVWVPGDQFVVLEVVQRDSVRGGRVVIEGGAPVTVTDTVVSFGPAVLGCNAVRTSCNPIRFGTRGATGYLVYQPGWKLVINYPSPFTVASEVALRVDAPVLAPERLTKAQLAKVRVVPNPYVFQSDFDVVSQTGVGDARIMFTGVPAEGTLRVYSVSGQYLQQLSWTAADLNGTGDLPYNLRTREGTELAAGLYIYVITPRGAGNNELARGKFVVLR